MSRHHRSAHHHKNAADHFEQAAEHHRNASEQYAAGNDKDAAYHAQVARGFALHGHEQSNHASKNQAYQEGFGSDWNGDSSRNGEYSRNGSPSHWDEDNADDDSQDNSRYSARNEDDSDDDYSSSSREGKLASAKGRKRMMPPNAAKARGREGQQQRRSH